LLEYENDTGSSGGSSPPTPTPTPTPDPPTSTTQPPLSFTTLLSAILQSDYLDVSATTESADALLSDLADLLRETYNASAVTLDSLAPFGSDDTTFPTMVDITVEFDSEGACSGFVVSLINSAVN
jgi:hypothetical protein